MPPKKSRAAAGGTKAVSASQPEPQRPTRTSGRKRRHSDGSNVSDAPSSQGSATTTLKTPAKRRKKGKVTTAAEPEVIVEEDEEDVQMADGEAAGPTCGATSEAQDAQASEAEDSIKVSQTSTKQVHFETTTTDTDKTTATNITPYPRKMTIKRRTMSPSAGSSTKRIKTSRTSLPATLSQDTDPGQIIQEWQFAPLRAVLDERVRRLMEAKIESSQSDVEADDDGDQDVPNAEMLVLENHQAIQYPQLPTPSPETQSLNGDHSPKARLSTEASAVRAGWNEERRRFGDAVVALQKEADLAKSRLQVLTIELEALGFAEADDDTASTDYSNSSLVIQSIRESFDVVRDFLESELPGTIPDDAENQDLLEILIANLKEFAERLRTSDKELVEKGTLAADLGHQVDGLLDHLAEKEVRNKELEKQWMDLDKSNDSKTTAITELETKLDATTDERDSEAERAGGLEIEKAEFEKTIERLSTSLQTYRDEELHLTELITQMEDEHRNTVSKMNKEREDTVRDLETRLDEETERYNAAQKLADERDDNLTDLKINIQALEAERDDLLEKLKEANAERDEESQAKETAQADLEERTVEVEDLETRVDRFETELGNLNEELETLRNLNDAERSQREAAETEVDYKTTEVDDLTQKLRDAGEEANKLRMKIYELQKKADDVGQQMSDRDEQFQEDMSNEVERREAADVLAQERAATVSDLQRQLEELEGEMHTLLRSRDERIMQLEDDVAQKEADYQNLEDSYGRELTTANVRIEDLEGSIAVLQDTISGHENTIQLLQQQAVDHESQTEDRDTTIADLNHKIGQLAEERDRLADDKTNLERRVESEAEQMLEIQNDLTEEIADLKATIRDKQAKIRAVEDKSKAAEKLWEDVVQARKNEIAELQNQLKANTSHHEETVDNFKEEIEDLKTSSAAHASNLKNQNEDIKRKFRAYVRRSTDTIARLQEQLEAAKAAVDEEGGSLMDEGDGLLKELDEMDVPDEEPGHHALAQQKVGRKTRGRKKRVVDSGIGLEPEAVEEDDMVEA